MPTKRVLISIDERLLDRIDHAAARGGLTRSGLIASLAGAALDGQRGPGVDPGVRAALVAIDHLAEHAES